MCGHDLLQRSVVQLAQEAIKGPVGRQRSCNVETAVVGNEQIAVEEVHQIGDLCKAFAFHDDKRTEHGFLGIALAPGCGAGQDKLYTAEELVVK